jgi:2-deoxy-D-gluconate 3-dehydrogenase
MNLPPLAQLIDLKDKTAIVTGGAMGIGFGIAYRLAESGASVTIADVHEESGKRAVADLTARGYKALFVKTDVAQEAQVLGAVHETLQAYGGIDILVNNAGIFPIIPVMSMAVTDFERIISVNMKSVFLFTKAVSEVMIKQGRGGKIINITSIDALHPSAVGLAVYDASKHGVWGFTKNTALELAQHNIQVNAIAPGGINTPGTGAGAPRSPEIEVIQKKFIQKIPMKRMGESDEIGKVALFLASDLSSYMTGAQIVVDGGVLLA